MNGRERTLTTINGQADRVPFNPFIMHLAARLTDVPYSPIYCQKGEVLADCQIRCARFFGIDHVNVSSDAFREASAWGVKVDFSHHTPVAKSNLNWENFESIETPDINTAVRMQDRIKAVSLLKQKIGQELVVIGWIEAPFAELTCLFGIMPIINLVMQKNGIPIIQKLLDRILPIQIEFAKAQIDAGADIIGAGDSIISQIGPRNYYKTSYAHTKRLFAAIKNHVPILYHPCGDNSVVTKDGYDMPNLLADSGASILDCDFQVDLTTEKQKIGEKICLRGNVNTQILGSGEYDLNRVIQEISAAIIVGKPNGRYMYAAGCEIPWEPFDLATRNLSLARALTETLGKY